MSGSFIKNKRGFSLVELMVVVAIIGILASIAIPSINKYMAKARQSEAKTNLSSIYTAEKAFFTEYNTYDSRFAAVGYTPEGQLRYNIGFTGGVQAGPAQGYATAPAVNAIAASTGAAAAYCGIGGTFVNGCTVLVGASGANAPAISAALCTAPGNGNTTPAGCTTATTTFQAGATAMIQSNAASADGWAMDGSKMLRNTVNGIQ